MKVQRNPDSFIVFHLDTLGCQRLGFFFVGREGGKETGVTDTLELIGRIVLDVIQALEEN